jgi:hypothetical protein
MRVLPAIALWCCLLAACNGKPDALDAPKPDGLAAADSSDETLALKGMDQEQQAYLWDVEHYGNVLAQIGFPALTKALRAGDETALAAILGPSFEGGLLREPNEAAIHNEFLNVVRQSDAGKPPVKVEAKEFLVQLLELRGFFKHSVLGAKLALMKLRPTREKDLDAPWQGTGQLRLWGEREPCKPAEVIVYLAYQTVRPTKEAMAKGGWLLSCSITQSQRGWSDHFLMRESAAERGMEPDRLQDNWKLKRQDAATGGVYLCDFDRDGWLDVLITDINGYFLYKGLPGGRFQNVTEEYGLPAIPPDSNNRSLTAAWIDIDGDGWEDLILGKYVFRNEQGKRFRDYTSRCNLRLPITLGGLAVADYDRDGKMDVYAFQPGKGKASSWLDGKSGHTEGGGNQLWRNKGDWQFEEVTAQSGTDGGDRSTFTALWLDANNDGWPDLFVPNEFGNGVLYINNGNGTFRATYLTDAPCDFGTMGATCGDINNDGNIDIYCGNMYSKAGSRVINNVRDGTYPRKIMDKMRTFVRGSQLHLNHGGQHWEQRGQEWQVHDAGWAYGPALIDLDNDGWLDIHATCGFISRSRSEPDG